MAIVGIYFQCVFSTSRLLTHNMFKGFSFGPYTNVKECLLTSTLEFAGRHHINLKLIKNGLNLQLWI